MKLRKILSCLLIVIMASSVLTGCLKKEDTSPKSADITNSEQTFDKKTPADVVFTVDYKGKSVERITNGGVDVANTNYSSTSNSLTIKKEYLSTLNLDTYNFELTTTHGGTSAFRIIVVDTTPGAEQELPYQDTALYNNYSFHQWQENLATIPNQWEGYGIGDPYILRHNGVYYLYCSTKDSETGIKAYKSTDLINWTPCQGAGLPLSYVSMAEITKGAYAPEVIYHNGTFYLYMARHQKGHSLLKANSPEGPFELVEGKESLGMQIDGSVFVDDNEQMYFTHANTNGITMVNMSDPETFGTNRQLASSGLGGWTEGSYIIKRNGIYYLTYTGTHIESDAYRIGYSYLANATSPYPNHSANPTNSFKKGADNPLILNTSESFRGLGHSVTVMGPDMDSYYIAYHNLNGTGPNRSLNIDRLQFNGTHMTAAAKLNNSVVPTLPEFTANGTADTAKFTTSGNFKLSTSATQASYNAEFNYSGSDNVRFVVGYTDANNYSYVKLDATGKKIYLQKVTSGTDAKVAEGTIVNSYNMSHLYTIRVTVGEGKTEVYFNNLLKITANSAMPAGKIGYNTTASGEVGYTAFSNVSMGMSDKQEVKQAEFVTPAVNYIPNNYIDGFNGSMLGANSTVAIADSSVYNGANALKLENKFNYARYGVNFDADGFYGLEMVFDKQYMGSTIAVQFNNGNSMYFNIPVMEANASDKWMRTIVSEFDVKAGVNILKIENYGDSEFEFVSFRFVKTSKSSPQFSHNLATIVPTGSVYKTLWTIKNGGHYSSQDNRQVVFFGDETITDFTLSVDMTFEGDISASSAGIIFRAKNYSVGPHDSFNSVQGYYVGVDKTMIRVAKINYDATNTYITNGVKAVSSSDNNTFNLKVEVRGNVVKVYKNGTLHITAFDALAFSAGRLGLYTDGAGVVYKNLVITP